MPFDDFSGGVNWRLPPWHKDMTERKQCVLLQNLRYRSDWVESILGTRKYQSTSVGTDPITAIMPYYNDQTDDFSLLMASGSKVYRKNQSTNEFDTIASGLSLNSIYSSVIRHGVMYIPSVKDGLKKYLGGTQLESVGGGDTAPGSFRYIIYMKENDRLFGISDDAIFGQISWCDLGDPETWDGASVERIKLEYGERVEGAEILYGKLIIFCTYSVWIYYVSGNEENWRLEKAPTNIGCVAPNTIKKVGNEIYYLGESPRNRLGVYAFNGSTSRYLTDDMFPFINLCNRNKLRNACAEVHDDLYTFTLAIGASETNNYCLDLDLLQSKADGTPAIFGPHPFGFFSACVLDGRKNNKQFLMGDQQDGFVYYENGNSFKSTNGGSDGQLMQGRFLSMVHNDGNFETMRRYENLFVNFRPRGFFNAKVNYYLSTGTYGTTMDFNQNAQAVGFAGDFNIYEKYFYGTPELYKFWEPLGAGALGTSIQIEIVNDNIGERIAFDAYGYSKTDLHTVKRAQLYAD